MNSQKYNKRIVLILFSVLTSSCTIGPNYNPILFELPENYKETGNEKWKLAEPADESVKGKWWTIFQDPTLNELEDQIEISNQNIAASLAQYEQAQALLGQAKSGHFPSVSGSGGVSRQRQSATSSFPATESTSYNTSLNASWIPDLWGSVRRSVEANEASVEASAAQLENIKLTAQSSLAQYYFQLRMADNDQKILDDIVDNYKKLLDITEQLKEAGTASLIDYNQIASQFEQAKAQATDNKTNRSQYEHAIAVLLGKAPSQFLLESNLVKLSAPAVPLLLPSKLLERRPDVAQTERLVAQANAQIGVAVAAYFPNLNLTGNAGYSKNSYTDLFSLPALFWSLGANLAETIFDGGLREQKIKAAEANYKAVAAQYKQTVLVALQNVEDNLAASHNLKIEEDFQTNATNSTKVTENLILQGYKTGIKTYSDLLNSQINLYNSLKTLNALNGKRMINSVNLIASLGGIWEKPNDKKENN